jgi:adenylate cyclase
VADCAELKRRGIAPLVASGYNANLERLQDKAAGAAFFNMEADFDGVARRMPVVMEHQGRCFGSLALMTTMAGMGSQTLKPLPAAGHRPPVLDLDGLRIPVDAAARALVPYRAADAFAYLSASDVIHARAPAASLEGRIALIGSTAPGIMDLRVTPVSKVFPGVEIHANLISGILDGTVKWEPVGIAGMEVAAIAVVGLLLAALLPIATPLWAALATLALTVALTAANFYAWTGHACPASPGRVAAGGVGPVRAEHELRLSSSRPVPRPRSPSCSASTSRRNWWTRWPRIRPATACAANPG